MAPTPLALLGLLWDYRVPIATIAIVAVLVSFILFSKDK